MITGVVAVATAAVMEPWAEWVHRVVWHGPLWGLHRSHHRKHHDRFEANDVLSIAHAPVAMTAIFGGIALEGTVAGSVILGIGLGMTAFGAAYVTVHDGLVHGRLPVQFLARIGYFRWVRDAHLVHHRGDHGPYGLFVPTRIGAADAPPRLDGGGARRLFRRAGRGSPRGGAGG